MDSQHSRSCVCSVSPPGIPPQLDALPAANAVHKFISIFLEYWFLIQTILADNDSFSLFFVMYAAMTIFIYQRSSII
jgi:hypothetical protein